MTAPSKLSVLPPLPSYCVDDSFRSFHARTLLLASDEEGSDIVSVSRRAILELARSDDLLRAAYLWWTHDNFFVSRTLRTCCDILLGCLEVAVREKATKK